MRAICQIFTSINQRHFYSFKKKCIIPHYPTLKYKCVYVLRNCTYSVSNVCFNSWPRTIPFYLIFNAPNTDCVLKFVKQVLSKNDKVL